MVKSLYNSKSLLPFKSLNTCLDEAKEASGFCHDLAALW